MNFMFPEDLDRVNRQKIERDRLFILREGMIAPESNLSNALGNWMIATGKKLRRKCTGTVENSRLIFLPDETRIFKA